MLCNYKTIKIITKANRCSNLSIYTLPSHHKLRLPWNRFFFYHKILIINLQLLNESYLFSQDLTDGYEHETEAAHLPQQNNSTTAFLLEIKYSQKPLDIRIQSLAQRMKSVEITFNFNLKTFSAHRYTKTCSFFNFNNKLIYISGKVIPESSFGFIIFWGTTISGFYVTHQD